MVKKTYPITADQLDTGVLEGQVPELGPGGALPAGISVSGSSVVFNNTGTNFNSTNMQAIGTEVSDAFEAMLDPTGFVNQTDSTISLADGTGVFTITPVGANFAYYIHGKKYTITTLRTVTIADTEGMHYIYLDVDGQLHETGTFTVDLLLNTAYVSAIYWDATNNKGVYVADERHGLTMDGQTHMHFHMTLGTQYISGLGLSNFVVDGTGDLATNAQFSADGGVIRDEDLQHTIVDGAPQDISPIAQIPIMWRSGATGSWRIKTASSYPLVYSGDSSGYVGANSRIPYNQWTGTTWQLTEASASYYVLVHYFATNDIRNPIIGVQGNQQYNILSNARLGANNELKSLTGIPFAEFVPIATVIYQTASTYLNVPKARTISTDLGAPYVDWRTVVEWSGPGVFTDHGALSGLSDDDHLQYHTDTRGDARYHTKTFLNTALNHASTGVLSGGTVTAGTPNTTVSITAGSGIIVDNYTDPSNPTYQVVSWPAFTNTPITNIATADKTYLAINSSAALVQQTTPFTPSEHRTLIILAVVAHASDVVEVVRNDQHAVFDVTARLGDLAHAIGQFNITGNVYGSNGANLNINKSAGQSYRLGSNFYVDKSNPDITADVSATPVSFRYTYRNGSGGWIESASTTTVVPGSYDNGSGTLQAVPTNSWTVQVIEFFSGANAHRIEYGQKVYATIADALSAVPLADHVHNPNYAVEGVVRSYLVVRGGATNLSLSADAQFVEAAKFEGGGGTVPPRTGHAYQLTLATAGQTVFNLNFSFAATDAANYRTYHTVYVNGLKQTEGASYNYTVTGSSQITFNAGANLLAGDRVEVYGL